MTSIYEQELPKVFPFFLAADHVHVRAVANLLLHADRDDVPYGSSFAITVEHGQAWLMWLSSVSAKYVKREWPHLGQQIQSTRYYTDKE